MEKSTACSIFTNNLEFGWTKIRVAKNCFPPCLAISQKKVRSPQSLAAKDLFQNLLGNQWLYGICNFLVLRDAAWRPKEDNKDWSSKRKSWAPQCSVDRPCLPVEKPWSCQVCHWFGSWSILPRQSIEYIHVFIYIQSVWFANKGPHWSMSFERQVFPNKVPQYSTAWWILFSFKF